MGKFDVFISHSHKDKAIADAICHHFENEKIKCWMAPRDITPGASWAGEITRAIPKCRILLLIFSSNSNMSHQVLREVELAVKNKLIVMPVKIEDIDPTDDMEYYLSTVHWVDVVNKKTEKYIKKLTETIKGFLELSDKMPADEIIKIKPKKRNPLAIWISVVVVVILVVLGIVFRDSIFGGASQRLDASAGEPTETIEITEAPTAEPTVAPTEAPTAEPTAEPTIAPTATIDPNIALDTVVEIPDIGLKTAVLRTLNDMGEQVFGNITVGDMQKLTTLVIMSADSYDEGAVHGVNGYKTYPISLNAEIKNLEGLQYANNLVQLHITGVGLEDISAISPLYKIEAMDIGCNKIEDISALANLGNLTLLNSSDNNISDISSMILLYNIEKLFLNGNPISDIGPLRDMSEMTSLAIGDMNLSDISPLSGMTKLKELSVAGNPLDNIDALENLTELNDLHISECGITDISALSGLVNLQGLSLMNNDFTDASSLINLNNLDILLIDEDVQNLNEDTINALIQGGCEVFNDVPDEYEM